MSEVSDEVIATGIKLRECYSTDDDGIVALYFRGKMNMAHFSEAVKWYCENHGIEPDDGFGKPRIAYWRKIPNRRDGGSIFKSAVRGSRGAFVVTVCDLRPWVA